MDRLQVHKTGESQLNGVDHYCGQVQNTSVSPDTRRMGLITANTSPVERASGRQATCRCGYRKLDRKRNTGEETGVNEFPMMVGLGDAKTYMIKCGGVIIDKRYVLTAAHCVVQLTASNLAVIVGEHNVATGDETPATVGHKILDSIIHPQYSSENNDYDIAILKVEKDIVFSDRVGPVCLPFNNASSDFTGIKLTILGWGTINPGGPKSDVLRKVDVDVISQSDCQSKVHNPLTDRQFCTYTLGMDACQDDSGGPLLYLDESSGMLFNVGIVSFGQFCATRDKPGVNTFVPALLDWILENTPDAEYCHMIYDIK